MKNNKGVTLVELLIVIVVMGIIAAFAVPSVQTIISNTRKSSVYADALALEQAADLYCADTLCASTVTLDWGTLKDYVELSNDAYYTLTDTTDVAARSDNGPWGITLEVATTTGDWEFDAGATPSALTRDTSVRADTN
jgi:type IV pilus assembly protein PilA